MQACVDYNSFYEILISCLLYHLRMYSPLPNSSSTQITAYHVCVIFWQLINKSTTFLCSVMYFQITAYYWVPNKRPGQNKNNPRCSQIFALIKYWSEIENPTFSQMVVYSVPVRDSRENYLSREVSQEF